MIQWKQFQIEQFEKQSGFQLLRDSQSIETGNKDFGGLHKGQAFAVFKPVNLEQAQVFLMYATRHGLPVAIRCHGLSQAGQSLAREGQVLLDVSALNYELQLKTNTIRAGCSVSWADIILRSLRANKLPPVFPYNTRLSLGGVLSVGGLGSASAQQGTCVAHVVSLQVLKIDGTLVYCDERHNSDLMDAVLAGTGQFGIIYSAELQLQPVSEKLYTRNLYFTDAQKWLEAQFVWRDKKVKYMEANCLFADPQDFSPLEQPLYRISLADEEETLLGVEHGECYEEPIEHISMEDYVFRHEARITKMMSPPYVNYFHPWFECYARREVITAHIRDLVNTYPRSLGPMLHCFPVARRHARLFQMPEGQDIMTFNILTPGVAPDDMEECRNWILKADALLRKHGGKRYISSWIEDAQNQEYWQQHYGMDWELWQRLKHRYDPQDLWGGRKPKPQNIESDIL